MEMGDWSTLEMEVEVPERGLFLIEEHIASKGCEIVLISIK